MSGRGGVKDVVSFVRARKAENLAALANGDVSSLVSMIEGLQQQVADLSDAVAALQTHTHNYTDVDNLAATLNKVTATPN